MFFTTITISAALTAAASDDTCDLLQRTALDCHLPLTSQVLDVSPAVLADDPAGAPPFGEMGSKRWNLFAGGGPDLDGENDVMALVGGSFSYFLVDDLSLDFELDGVYFSGDEDAFGPNLNLLLRWHFCARETWSIYVDGGAGIIWTTEQVPSDGSQFNFTPQVGAGATFELRPNVRMMIGARFHHLSNANLDDSNPGTNHLLAYIGVSWPY
jgi:hypothetical protein